MRCLRNNNNYNHVLLLVLCIVLVISHSGGVSALNIDQRKFLIPVQSTRSALDILYNGFGFQTDGTMNVNISISVSTFDNKPVR